MQSYRGWFFGCLMVATTFGNACAGIYHFGEPVEWEVPDTFVDTTGNGFYSLFAQLRALPAPQVEAEQPYRKRYLLMEHAAGTKAKLTPEQIIDLSAVLLRRGNPGGAIQLLLPISRQEPNNFMVFSHLASAYAAQGNLAAAADYQKLALDAWNADLDALQKENPALYKLWDDNQLKDRMAFYREVEKYQLKLYRARQRETLINKGKPYETVDALFGEPGKTVKYVGESGKFEVGKIAAAEKAKLPDNALAIMQQLLLWNPQDRRLFWQLGELYNAKGGAKNIQAARKIFDELTYDLKERAEEAVARKQALHDYVSPPEPVAKPPLGFEVKTLAVGMAIGTVVGVFLVWQVREFRRRWTARSARGR